MADEKNETLQDLIAHEEWSIEYHTKGLEKAKIKLNALKMSVDGKEPVDIDKMLFERKYHV